MSSKIGEIKDREDALKFAAMILSSLRNEGASSYPFKGRIVQHSDGTILFMGEEIKPHEAAAKMAELVWRHRAKLNRQIKRSNATGGTLIDCGC
ncbi:MAG: hypothetical protein RBS57_10775 [Desulforhabdus sp.]|jgi:hypothetical protein|nr:hypothetical protein [Desulforhabdus sp.]